MADQAMDILQGATLSLGPGATSVSVVLDAECATSVDDATPYPGDIYALGPGSLLLGDGALTIATDAGPVSVAVTPGPAIAGGNVVTSGDGPVVLADVGLGPGPIPVVSGTVAIDEAGLVETALVVGHIDVTVGEVPGVATVELQLPAGGPTTIHGPASFAVTGGLLHVPEQAGLELSDPQPRIGYTLDPELSPSVARWDLLRNDPTVTSEIGRAATALGVEPELVTRLVSQHSGWMATPGYGVEEFRTRLWGELAGFPDEQRTKAHTAIDGAMTVALQQMFQKKVLTVPDPVSTTPAAPMFGDWAGDLGVTKADIIQRLGEESRLDVDAAFGDWMSQSGLTKADLRRELVDQAQSATAPMFGDWAGDLGVTKADIIQRLGEESRLDVDAAFGDWMSQSGLTKADLQAKLEE